MSESKQSGFIVSQGRIALVLSLVTLLGVFYNGAAFILDTQYRITALEEKWGQLTENQKVLGVEIGKLSTSIQDLNLVLRILETRQQESEKEGVKK